ncbi:histone-lysine N-methyltransferase SETMAR-like [Pseudomyrmex gracilis]|uniref:histone-lysine N-methyltransferase SETMAR-like n=1 Tax=Pseudomyrmex gracilis TaxID=219809 RepID=UPI0009959D66|nr:histone-lysine N-methyltransferase SETMAR-like [Pseudomyrmex gracilis]
MERTEIRAVIKFYVLKGKTVTQIKSKLNAVLGNSSPSISTVHTWVTDFKRGRTSCEDAHRSGRPNKVTTPAMIQKIHKIVMDDCRLKLRDIAEIVDISSERVHNILHEHLNMKKLCTQWVPRLLTLDQKQRRMDVSTECLQRYKRNPKDFLSRFVTVGETWVHHYTPDVKEQWTETDQPAPKKAKMIPSTGNSKVIATVFWDARGIIFVDYFEKGKIITGEYYANLLQRLSDEIEAKRPDLATNEVLFHQNASARTLPVVMAKIYELGFELLPHPSYSPDLAPCEFHLFPNLNKWLGGKRFSSNHEVIDAVNVYFEELEKSFYQSGISALEKRWSKCIEARGDYIDK